MEQSPSWKANRSSVSPETRRILWNSMDHSRIHNSPPLVLFLSHINPAHSSQSYFLNNHSSILVLFSHLRLGLRSGLYLSSPHHIPAYTSPLPIRTTCPTHFIILYLITPIKFCDKYRSWSPSLSRLRYSPVTSSLRPNYLPQHRTLEHPQSVLFLQYDRPSFTPIQNTRKIYRILLIKCLYFVPERSIYEELFRHYGRFTES